MFTGRATDSLGVFDESPEDVSPLVTMISPTETPYLDLVGDADFVATKTLHEYMQDKLAPNSVLTTTAITSLAAGDSVAIGIAGGRGKEIPIGAVLEMPILAGGEQLYVTAVSPSTITCTKGFAGTNNAASIGAGIWLDRIATAKLEGDDGVQDTSRARDRLFNIVQLFKLEMSMSGTEKALTNIGVGSEWDYQTQKQTKQNLIDLERACIRSRIVGSVTSVGGAESIRAMRGLFQSLSTNNHSYGSYTSIGDFEVKVNTMIRSAWRNGGSDLSHILMDPASKELYDQLNASRVRTMNGDQTYSNRLFVYECTYGIYQLMMNRWFPAGKQAVIAKGRIRIAPLKGRSFHREVEGKRGDAERAFIVGEYTQEVRNEEGMAQMFLGNLATSAIPTP